MLIIFDGYLWENFGSWGESDYHPLLKLYRVYGYFGLYNLSTRAGSKISNFRATHFI